MSNIYLIIDKLEQSLDSPNFTYEQKLYIKALLLGQQERWRPLKDFAESPLRKEIYAIIYSLQDEVQAHGSNGFLNNTYDHLLGACLRNFCAMRDHFSVDSRLKNDSFIKFANKYDEMFQQTIEKYHGNVILPICQGLDVRLGDSGGECHGYVCQWAMNILEKKKPFGIDINQPSPFKPIKLNSKLGKSKIEWNHLAVLNKNISQYQKKLPDELKNDIRKNPRFYTSISTLSRQLFIKVNKYPHKIFELDIFGGMGFTGHALGFCKIGEDYHFFDSNALWVSFKKSADFELWLSYYFSAMNYDRIFNEYYIQSYQLATKKQHGGSKTLFSKDKSYLKWAENAIVIAAVVPVVGAYLYAVRPLIHATMGFGKTCKAIANHFSKNNKKLSSAGFLNDISEDKVGRIVSNSMDDIDAFVQSSTFTFIDSTCSLALGLDVDVEKLYQAKKNLIENNNKLQFFKPKHGVSVDETEKEIPHDVDLSKCVIPNYF